MNWRLVVMAITPASGILWRTIGALAAECHRRKSAAFVIGASFLLFCCHVLSKRLQKRMIIPIHICRCICCRSPAPFGKVVGLPASPRPVRWPRAAAATTINGWSGAAPLGPSSVPDRLLWAESVVFGCASPRRTSRPLASTVLPRVFEIQKPPRRAACKRLITRVTMVAGTGFEPVTFRL